MCRTCNLDRASAINDPVVEANQPWKVGLILDFFVTELVHVTDDEFSQCFSIDLLRSQERNVHTCVFTKVSNDVFDRF